MGEAHQADAASLAPAAWGIVSPNGKQAMLDHARQYSELKIPSIFDPGQGLPMFSGDELRALIRFGHGADGERLRIQPDLRQDRLERSRTGARGRHADRHPGRAKALTCTAQGKERETIKAAPVGTAIDPTGCGDAYRGGLLYGLAEGWDWSRCAMLGSVMGAIKIESQGPQNHAPDRAAIAARFESAYGSVPW